MRRINPGELRRARCPARKLGKHSAAGGCLYIKRLSDVDLSVLKKVVDASVKRAKKASA